MALARPDIFGQTVLSEIILSNDNYVDTITLYKDTMIRTQ